KDAGLSVILDMHEDVYGEGFGFDGAPRWTCDEARYAAFVPRTPWYLSSVDENVQSCVDHFYTDRETRQPFIEAWRHVAGRLGRALWIGEYGGLSDKPTIGEYMRADYDGAGAVAASTSYWDYSRGGGYSMRAADGTPKQSLLAALVRPYPERVAGDPIDYAFD